MTPPSRKVSRYDHPPILRAAFWRSMGLLALCIVLLPLTILVLARGWIGGILAVLLTAGLAAVVFLGDALSPAFGAILGRRERRLYKTAEAAGFRVCPCCLYRLEAESGVCPECGVQYTMDDVLASWRQAPPGGA